MVSGAQALGGLVFTAYKSLQIFKGWDPKNMTRTGELTHTVAAQLEMATIPRSMHLHPDAVLESTDFATRARRNAITSKALALGSEKSESMVDAMLPDAQRPMSWKDRAVNLKNSAKNKVKGWGQAIQAKSRFNVTETILRGVCVGFSATMLVLACITAGQLWVDQSPVERILGVINLLVQTVNLIIEVATIFKAVPGWIGIAMLVVGILLPYLITWFFGDPKADTPSVVAWYNSNWTAFLSSTPEEPLPRYEYKAEVDKLTPGQDTTIAIICKPREKLLENGFTILTDISARFTASATDTNSLFNSRATPISEALSTSGDLQPGECSIVRPESLQQKLKRQDGKDEPAFLANIIYAGTSPVIKTYELGIQVNNDGLAADQPRSSIRLAAGEQLVLKMRGVIASAGERPADDKVDYKTDVPPWRKYQLRIVETYSDDKGEPQGIMEAVIDLEKV